MRKKAKGKKAVLTAEQIDAMHDAGEDLSPYVDYSKARRPGLEIHRVNVDFPQWIIDGLDREARKLGISRQALIKVWIGDRLERGDEKKIA
jgi:hypothetical protein